MRIPAILVCLSALSLTAPLVVGADQPESYELHSARAIGQIDRANVLLEASGDLLVRSASGSLTDKPERREVNLACRRDYDEKMLQLPSGSDKTIRAIRFYREASAKLQKGSISLNPALRRDHCLVGVEINGAKVTPFSPRGPLNVDELELLSAVGETLPLDELMPTNPVKIGGTWPVPNETVAVLLGLDDVTTNSVQTMLKEVTPEFARLELAGRVEGKLYGATNQITLKAKCRFDRHAKRIDWFAMGLQQTREVSMVESGLDWTFQVKVRVTPLATSDELSEKALAELPLKPSDDMLRVQYQLDRSEIQLTHDRAWFLTGHFSDRDEFHRLDRGQDMGLCKVSPLPQISAAKLPTAAQFQEVVHKALDGNFGEVVDVTESRNEASLRILRVAVTGKDGDVPVRWSYYHVSDPEGRQVTLTFCVEEKNLDAFDRADDAMAQSVRFVEKVEKK
jgi:hypothetical protein